MIGAPSRLRLIRKAAALARIFPHFDQCYAFREIFFFNKQADEDIGKEVKMERNMDGFGEENISPPSVFDGEQDGWVSIPQDSPLQQVWGWL